MNKVLLTIGIVFGMLVFTVIVNIMCNILIFLLGVKVLFGLVLLGVGYFVYNYVIPEFTNTK